MALRSDKQLLDLQTQDDGLVTKTSTSQLEVEATVERLLSRTKFVGVPTGWNIEKKAHIGYLRRALAGLSTAYECLDASKPWLIYWIVHSLDMLGYQLNEQEVSSCIGTLTACQSPNGGFCGGPGQMPHLAPTYAAVNALCAINTEESMGLIDRPKLRQFLGEMRQPDGSFTMHHDGEVDIRGAYCAASAAFLSQVNDEELFRGTADWISRCQTYEGGIAAVPGTEAHGGYAFCGLAAAVLLGAADRLDIDALLKWACRRQMRLEGGFQGRTHKLVDGCYSFWVGAVFPLVHDILVAREGEPTAPTDLLYLKEGLRDYVTYCCQRLPGGGLIDKPGKHPDYYHTCYCLSGLASSLYVEGENNGLPLRATHPLFNICLDKAVKAEQYFAGLASF